MTIFTPFHWLRSDPYSYFKTSSSACAFNLERRVLNSFVIVVDKIMTRYRDATRKQKLFYNSFSCLRFKRITNGNLHKI
jgi:hypothetical protein